MGRKARLEEDIGCKEATEHLGYQSFCLQCPFEECLLMLGEGRATREKKIRNEEMKRRFEEGERVSEVARQFGVRRRTVLRVVKEE